MPCKNHPTVHANLNQCARCADLLCADCLVQLGGQYYCANCKGEQVKDIQSGTGQPGEELAERWKRFVAFILDSIIVGLPVGILAFVLMFGTIGFMNPNPTAASMASLIIMQVVLIIVSATLHLLYEGLMLQHKSATLGKMVLRIKVVGSDGEPLTTGQAWGRSALKVLFANMSIVMIIDYVFIFSADRATLHDKAGRTKVINVPD